MVAQVAALLAGDVDGILRFGALQALKQFQADPRFTVEIGSTAGKGLLAINHRRKPLDDLRVRRALSHAVDRQAFIATARGDDGITLHALDGRTPGVTLRPITLIDNRGAAHVDAGHCAGRAQQHAAAGGAAGVGVVADREAGDVTQASCHQAKTPAVSCMRALTSPRWCSVSPRLSSSMVSRLK